MFSACAKQDKTEAKPEAKIDKQDAAVAKPSVAVVPPPAQPKQATQRLARRCVLAGDPLSAECGGGDESATLGPDGTLHVAVGKEVRRYKRGDSATECRFEPSGEPIALPPENPRMQSIDGPVYMRSGGPQWHLVRAGNLVYAHDYLGGLFRIDRGTSEPACVDVFGYKSLVTLGKRVLVSRKGIEELKLGKKCKAVSAKIDDKARDEIYVLRDKLYAAASKSVARYDGTTPVKIADGADICWAKSMTTCGDGLCVLDSNCFALYQLDGDGKLLRKIDDDQLFAARPYGLYQLVTADSGDVLVVAKHRDKVNDKELCETAIYELPAAVFAR